MKNSHRWKFPHRLGLIFLIFTLFSGPLSGCQLPWQKSANKTPLESSQTTNEEAQVIPSAPQIDLPPALVEIDPLPGSNISLDQPISLYFSQPMDTHSVEAALHFIPNTSGRFSWENDQILTFTPDQALAPETALRMTLNTSAQAANKQSLQNPIEVDFYTAKSLKVVQTMPAEGTQDVDPESVVFITFNQPVAALGAESSAEPAFSLSPEVPGTGEWLNTSTYLFKPETTMAGGTAYSIHLNPELQAVSGATLDEAQPVQFDFVTTQPAVLSILPLPGNLLNLDGPIEMSFNIRMDPESVADHFSISASDGARVAGDFEWDDNNKSFKFTPNQLLNRSTTYRIQLDSGAESAGGLPIATTTTTERATYPAFSLDSTKLPELSMHYGQFGTYKFHFTTPIGDENLRDLIRISPEIIQKSIYLTNDNTTVDLSGYFKPEERYTVSLDQEFTDLWDGSLDESTSLSFYTPPAEPSLTIATPPTAYNLLFLPASQSEIVLQATNINSVHMELAPISISDLITLLHPDNYNYRQIFLPETLEKSIQNVDLERNISEIIRIPMTYQGNPFSPGIYFLGVSSPEVDVSQTSYVEKLYLIVSDNNLVLKMTPEEAFIWATRLGDYSPLDNAPVKIYNTLGDSLISGKTDSDGIFLGSYTPSEEIYTSFFAIVGEPGQDDFAFSISTWNQSDSLYEIGIQVDLFPPKLDAYLYTDRPIYRPGDVVHFKTLIFDRDNGLPKQTELDQVTVTAYSSGGMAGIPGAIHTETLTLNNFGTGSGSFVLPESAPTGTYWLELSDGEQPIKNLYFNVAAYRKPEIEMVLEMESKEILLGDDLNAAIQADYYFGLPAVTQGISWHAFLEPAPFDLPGCHVGPHSTTWLLPEMAQYSRWGTMIGSGEDSTDNAGQANITFPIDQADTDTFQPGAPYRINLEVTLTDESGFPVTSQDSALVHPESFYIGVKPSSFLGRQNTPIQFSILTADWNANKIGDIPIEATFETIEWQLEETYDMVTPYRTIAKTTRIASASPITDQQGMVTLEFTPPNPGTYQLTLQSGNALTQVVLWVSGESSAIWPHQPQNQIQLTADTDNYQPGQIAQIFIPNPFPEGAKAMITVERGEVMETQVLTISGSGALFSLPITPESIPNIYLTAILLGKDSEGRPDYRQGLLHLPVLPLSKTLDVQLDIDPTLLQPGETVSATLLIQDQQGNPVQGEFSVAVVDKALLALIDPNSPSIIDALYHQQPLSVQTSLSLKTYASQMALSNLDLGMGGGSAEPEINLREDFPDTAYWQAEVVTGADGTAQLSIPLPDTLTTWVVDVRGLTEGYLVGQAEAEIVTQKELMIRPVTPRFLVNGDHVEMAAVVHNNTAEPLDVDISLFATGFNLQDESQKTQSVRIEPGSETRVTWMGIVDSTQPVELVFQAVSGFLSDSSTPTWGDLPILNFLMPQTFSTAGQLVDEEQRLEVVNLPLTTVPTSGHFTLEISASLTAILLECLQALENEPYDDTITILSRLLANLHTYQALSKLNIESSELEDNLMFLVNEGIRLLLDAQNLDGGWSWWAEDNDTSSVSDPFITAYVLFGLDQAVQAELDVDQVFIERAVDFLNFQLQDPAEIGLDWQLDQLAFQLFVLGDRNFGVEADLDTLYARRTDLSPWAMSLLALTIQETSGTNDRTRTLLSDLEALAVRSATGVHWESEQVIWRQPGTPVFNTAVVLYALAQLDPASTSLPLALRYLITHRNASGIWGSPFETTWSLMATIKALQGTGDYQSDYTFQASLNEIIIAEGTSEGTEPHASITHTTPVDQLHQNAPNALQIERSPGPGTLYYRADLLAYQHAADAKALDRGITLQKDFYLAGSGCPGGEECVPIDAITLSREPSPQRITVAITILSSQDLYHFMLEDFIPAGTEVINKALRTTLTYSDEPLPHFDPRQPFADGWGWWYFSTPQIYDDHLLWTADFLPAGSYTLTYELLPIQRGVFQVLPAHAWQFFYPEVMGTSTGKILTID